MPDTVFYFCPKCNHLIEKPDQAFCSRDAQKRPEEGWPSMETYHIATMPALNPRLFLSPEGDLCIFPSSLGPGAHVAIDEMTDEGSLMLRDGRRFTLSIVRSNEMVEVGLVPCPIPSNS